MRKNNKKNGTIISKNGKRINNKRITVRLSAEGETTRYTNVDKVYYQEIKEALKHASNHSLRGI